MDGIFVVTIVPWSGLQQEQEAWAVFVSKTELLPWI